VICSEAKISVYAETIHCNCVVVAFRSREIVGSAILTTRLSRIAIKSAKHAAMSVHHLYFCVIFC